MDARLKLRDDNVFRFMSQEPAASQLGMAPGAAIETVFPTAAEIQRKRATTKRDTGA